MRKHVLQNAQPHLAALRSLVTLKRRFWDLVHVTQVSRNDLLDGVHLYHHTLFPFKEHQHIPKPLNIFWVPNIQRDTLRP